MTRRLRSKGEEIADSFDFEKIVCIYLVIKERNDFQSFPIELVWNPSMVGEPDVYILRHNSVEWYVQIKSRIKRGNQWTPKNSQILISIQNFFNLYLERETSHAHVERPYHFVLFLEGEPNPDLADLCEWCEINKEDVPLPLKIKYEKIFENIHNDLKDNLDKILSDYKVELSSQDILRYVLEKTIIYTRMDRELLQDVVERLNNRTLEMLKEKLQKDKKITQNELETILGHILGEKSEVDDSRTKEKIDYLIPVEFRNEISELEKDGLIMNVQFAVNVGFKNKKVHINMRCDRNSTRIWICYLPYMKSEDKVLLSKLSDLPSEIHLIILTNTTSFIFEEKENIHIIPINDREAIEKFRKIILE